uniref:Uncharacterized protein n=1 Tax=Lutzomyia longipalpis TaxID=7200 RepID=A0A1B0CFL9_LUTLO
MLKGINERAVKRIKGAHYVATHGRGTPDPPYAQANRGYSTDGEGQPEGTIGKDPFGIYRSDIYVTSAAYKAPLKSGVCCLMLLLNLGLILVTLGFVIVIQFMEPVFVWILGIVFLIFGFLTLIGSMIYCVIVCRDAKTPSQLRNEDLYWTRHWQKNIGYTPHEINYKTDRYDGYSDRYSVSKMSGKYSDRESNHRY